MDYSDITFKDKNPVKRWLQHQRLVSAIKLYTQTQQQPLVICDFGGGNGELCKLLAMDFPNAKLICYEPTPTLLMEARQNLNSFPNVEFTEDVQSIPNDTVDVVFCLEVFEHLPQKETVEALSKITALLKSEGLVIIGVPVEVGIPAIYKGLFRISRRYGAFDAITKNIALASFGYPPKNRPMSEIAPGFRFYHEHMGFDFRSFKKTLNCYFKIIKISASPVAVLGSWLMPEVYFVALKIKPSN